MGLFECHSSYSSCFLSQSSNLLLMRETFSMGNYQLLMSFDSFFGRGGYELHSVGKGYLYIIPFELKLKHLLKKRINLLGHQLICMFCPSLCVLHRAPCACLYLIFGKYLGYIGQNWCVVSKERRKDKLGNS